MKALLIIVTIIITVFCFSFNEKRDNSYYKLYTSKLTDFKTQLISLQNDIAGANLLSNENVDSLPKMIELARLKLKNIDFWLRYFEPNAYRRLNGPLPIEWENEVFEKFEPPYKREGAGLSLIEISLDQKNINKDSLLNLIRRSQDAIKTFEADSIVDQLNTYSHFFLANRLFLLNLASIYTTGFECPDTSHIIPELQSMLRNVNEIYIAYNQSFPQTSISREYLNIFNRMILYVNNQPEDFSLFNHFIFIKNYINPLYSLNQKYINLYNVTSINLNDYTLNNNANSIFDKSLYNSQNTKGIYSLIEDETTLNEIRYIGKLLFYDPILSGNNMRSCASCHKPTQYFTDTSINTPIQFDRQHNLPRNAPTLINSIYNHLLMLDGKHYTLQRQGKDVITNPLEMNSNEKILLDKVLSCKIYKEAFRKFLKLTPEENKTSLEHIVSAITYYFGSFSRFYSPFDNAMNNNDSLSEEAVKGFNLFMSKAKCATCHFVPNFNGVKPPFIGSEFEVLGIPEDTSFNELSTDKGRYLINEAPETLHAFRTGSVRNAAYTKPYMHNGVFKSLEEVIDFYDVGGGKGKKLMVDNQTLSADSLKLSMSEKKELLAFIYSLNENIIFEDPPLSLPTSSDKSLNQRRVGGQY